jgi:flagellar M-ring protein FliF
VVQTLLPVAGNDRVKSSVTIDYDSSSGDSTQEIYDPATTAVLTSQISQETVGDLEPAGIPGTPSNAPNAQGNTAAANEAKTGSTTQGIHSESKTFAVSRTTRHTLEPAGRVKRVAAAILVDDAIDTKTENGKTQETRRKRTPEEMKQIEELAKAAIGFDAQRGDLFSLQNISFTTPPTEIPVPPGKVQRFLTFAERWISVLRYAAFFLLFALVYLLILRPVRKQVMQLLQAPAHGGLPANGTGVNDAAAALGVPPNLAALSAESGMGLSAETQHAVALKKQIVSKVKEDPESASRLIQNWVRQAEES